jgi:choline-sulfatase
MFRRTIVVLALAASSFSQAGKPGNEVFPDRPDVILVTIDTLRADHVGCYGYTAAETPTLDRLCAEGVKFTHAYTASPITNTSHASIMTGLYPSRHGVSDFGVPLPASHATLAEHFKKAGYNTAAFIGAVILDSSALAPGLNRGFDHYENFPAQTTTKERWERVERRADAVVAKATAWLASTTGAPRFLWVHLYDPHDPYEPPEPFKSKFAKNPYDGEIAYADAALGKLIAALEKQGRFQSAIVAVMSDHGEGLGEHGENTHGIFLYDSTLHIPLIVKAPDKARAATITQQVSSVDVLPTLLDFAGIQTPTVDGKSLKATVESRKGEDHVAFSETDYPVRFGWAPLKSIRQPGAKYIEAPRPEFYDLSADPKEQKNLYAPWNDAVQTLRASLAEFRSQAPQPSTHATAPVDSNTVEELKALGYLGTNPGATTVPEPSMLPDPKDKIQVQNLIHSGMMADEGGDMAAARKAFAAAVGVDPASAIALRQLGTLEYKSGEYKQAAMHLAQAYAHDAGDSTVALLLGQALVKTGDLKAAKDVLESALKSTPGQYDARVALGRAYAGLGNTAAAHDQYEAAMLLDGKRVEARLATAELLLAAGQKAAARAEIQKVLAANPKNAEALALLSKSK